MSTDQCSVCQQHDVRAFCMQPTLAACLLQEVVLRSACVCYLRCAYDGPFSLKQRHTTPRAQLLWAMPRLDARGMPSLMVMNAAWPDTAHSQCGMSHVA